MRYVKIVLNVLLSLSVSSAVSAQDYDYSNDAYNGYSHQGYSDTSYSNDSYGSYSNDAYNGYDYQAYSDTSHSNDSYGSYSDDTNGYSHQGYSDGSFSNDAYSNRGNFGYSNDAYGYDADDNYCGIESDAMFLDTLSNGCRWLPFPIEGQAVMAYDYFRSLPEGSWEGNTGVVFGVNLGMPMPKYACEGWGLQLGGSYGIYDWSGRGSALSGNSKEVQQEGFLTLGVFRKAVCTCAGWNFGGVIDMQFNKNAGVYALDPTLSQLRLQAGYLLPYCNELGIWGTINTNTSSRSAAGNNVKFRAINQWNLFWTHYFPNSARTMLWAGLPASKTLLYSKGRPGNWILGASFNVPLTDRLAIDGHATYMRARHRGGVVESRNYGANICLGITYAFGSATSSEDLYSGFKPYMSAADNSTFMVDTSSNY